MRLGLALLVACSAPATTGPTPRPGSTPRADAFTPLVDPQMELLITPSPEGHQPFVRAIDRAKSTIEMTMFHLTDPDVIDALIRAKGRGVDVHVILDNKINDKTLDKLGAADIDALKSSPAFSITHAKTMIVDHEVAFVTAINLTRDADKTRDLGIVTHDKDVIGALEELFEADRHNAKTEGHDTPRNFVGSLVVSPLSSKKRLLAVIDGAKTDLRVTVENMGDKDIEDALELAANRGVKVELIVPMCDKNPNPLYNLPAARALAKAGVDTRVMPAPETPETPYMHSKMILADGKVAYVGSINFSANSLMKAREIGIVVASDAIGAKIRGVFDTDWAVSVAPPADDPSCP